LIWKGCAKKNKDRPTADKYSVLACKSI